MTHIPLLSLSPLPNRKRKKNTSKVPLRNQRRFSAPLCSSLRSLRTGATPQPPRSDRSLSLPLPPSPAGLSARSVRDHPDRCFNVPTAPGLRDGQLPQVLDVGRRLPPQGGRPQQPVRRPARRGQPVPAPLHRYLTGLTFKIIRQSDEM